MVQSVISLKDIATGYSIFEKDQVLTSDQLNSVAAYLDDQVRLTRIYLVGVGLVCGLRASIDGGNVHVTKGVGITTDGDLITLPVDTVFDRFKAYDKSAPIYPPFYVDEETMIPVYELAAEGVKDEAALSLGTFEAETGTSLEKMVALLLMESYVKDDDLCSGTDCDNLGQDSVNTLRVLLVDRNSAGSLAAKISLLGDAHNLLQEVVADRPIITSSLTTASGLVSLYRAACDSTLQRLMNELSKVFTATAGFFDDVFPTDPTPVWTTRLNSISTSFSATNATIQYYYDFIKDLVETYNDFRSYLHGPTAFCCPDTTWFPKHLLLGNLVPDAGTEEHRTRFYPSPLTSGPPDQASHAKFLARKLDTLIGSFKVVTGLETAIQVTPSMTEEVSLEERAIPFYYQFDSANPIHRRWNFRLSQRGMDAYNYSYNAARYNAQGGAANPFGAQIGRFSFFRVEGHIGKEVTAAQKAIEEKIKRRNLPIAVKSVLLHSDKKKAVKPPIRYTDLHRLHYLVRNDVAHQLGEVDQFSGVFKSQIDQAVDKGIVRDTAPDSDGPTIKKIAEDRNRAVTTNTAAAKAKLTKSYSAYQLDHSWSADLSNAVDAAGQFKADLGSVVKTDFVTPFDSVMVNRNILWLDWLDKIIVDKQDTEDEKLLLSTFIDLHPGLEHFAGVTRGGTFVLAYDENKNVVGDFMLPYTCCDIPEPEPPQVVLDPPPAKPGSTVTGGIRITPSLDKFVEDKLSIFKFPVPPVGPLPPINADWDLKFKNLFDSMVSVKSSLDLATRAIDRIGTVSLPQGGLHPEIADPFLNLQVRDIEVKRQKVDVLRDQLLQPNLTPEAAKLTEAQLKAAEADVAKTFESTTRYISTSGVDVTSGSGGFEAMTTLFSALGSLKEPSALKTARGGLKKVGVETNKPELKNMINNILK